MIKLIASDMDGTLLDHQMAVSDETIEAIRKAEQKGIQFITATGRGIEHAVASLDPANIHVPMILLNGAQMVDEQLKTLFTVPIPRQKAFQIIDEIIDAGLYLEIFTEEHVYSENQAIRIEFFAERMLELYPELTSKMAIATTSKHMTLIPIDYVQNLKDTVTKNNEEVLKIIAFDKNGPENLRGLAEKLRKLQGLAITASDASNIEINHEDAQKGIALAHFAQLQGLQASEVMAVGDNFNDVSMLTYAGTSFAMANAAPEIKKIVTHVTASNEEHGVALAIKKVLAEE